MPEEDLPPQSRLFVEEDLPPQSRKVALYAAGGGFVGALLAIVVAKILSGPCCCAHERPERADRQPAAVSSLTKVQQAAEHILTA